MEKIHLTIEQWNSMKDVDGMVDIPVWFQVTGNSMFPFIRAFRDDVMIVSVPKVEYKIGDIVLFPAKRKGGDYCLHRLWKLNGDQVQTFGDGLLRPDGWFPRSNILGKAKLIRRGKRTIDCDDLKWRRRAARWCALWRVRPLLLLPHRVVEKIERIMKKW